MRIQEATLQLSCAHADLLLEKKIQISHCFVFTCSLNLTGSQIGITRGSFDLLMKPFIEIINIVGEGTSTKFSAHLPSATLHSFTNHDDVITSVAV